MKQIVTTAMLMAVGLTYANTQALYDCIYRYDMTGNANGKEISETSNCMLLIGEEQSKFYDYAAFRLDSVSSIQGLSDDIIKIFEEEKLKTETYFEQEINTSLKDNKLTVFCDMSPERYKYTEKLPLVKWELSEISDTICGYPCKKATGEYGGRKWQAWYSEEIPVPFGPWKITGLPGLVLKAQDEEGIHTFEAISFRQGNGEFAPSKIPNQLSISRDKFVELKNQYDIDPMNNINVESISSITVANKNVIVNGIRIPNHKNGSIPLEYSPAELKKSSKGESAKSNKNSGFDEIKVIGVQVQKRN